MKQNKRKASSQQKEVARPSAAIMTERTILSLPCAKRGGFCAAKRGGIVSARPKPPLCKGRWHGVSRDGGIVPAIILHDLQIDRFTIQSLSRYATAPFAGGSLFMFGIMRQLPMKPRSGFSQGSLFIWCAVNRIFLV